MEIASDIVEGVLGLAGAIGRGLLRPLGAERALGLAYRPVAVMVGLVVMFAALAGLLALLIRWNEAGA